MESGRLTFTAKDVGLMDHQAWYISYLYYGRSTKKICGDVAKVPRIERGGSKMISMEKFLSLAKNADILAAVGLEAYMACKNSGIKPDMFFGAREGAVEAAFHGMRCLILIVDEEFTDFLKRLETAGLSYTIHELVTE